MVQGPRVGEAALKRYVLHQDYVKGKIATLKVNGKKLMVTSFTIVVQHCYLSLYTSYAK